MATSRSRARLRERSEVGLDDRRVVGELAVGAAAHDGAALEDVHDVGDALDVGEVLLDQQDRGRRLRAQLGRSPRRRPRWRPVRGRATARRSAERAPGASSRARARPAGARRPRACAPSGRACSRPPAARRTRAAATRRRSRHELRWKAPMSEVLLDGHLGEQAVALHHVHDAERRDRLGRRARRCARREADLAAARAHEAAERAQERRLAVSVGADHDRGLPRRRRPARDRARQRCGRSPRAGACASSIALTPRRRRARRGRPRSPACRRSISCGRAEEQLGAVVHHEHAVGQRHERPHHVLDADDRHARVADALDQPDACRRRRCGPRPPNGSSSRSTCGSVASAVAIISRFLAATGSSEAGVEAQRSMPTSASASMPAATSARARAPPLARRGGSWRRGRRSRAPSASRPRRDAGTCARGRAGSAGGSWPGRTDSPAQDDLPGGRDGVARDGVEERRLARAVRARRCRGSRSGRTANDTPSTARRPP